MWKITQIYDGDFGCEGLVPGEKTKVSVTLKNDEGMKNWNTAIVYRGNATASL